ncbi:Txe/YoeB family addiction module toxin [Dyadobacter fanqingshengii]|uniref:Putative mRNA interferase YoeB n=1 Tax=Dyadobacter fanqingshengii TaxID=2906443 RepID=A0A9X1THQ5_9BACT|nr:Txe/YoeB family addiction module toxin [Dyadobacter fanqingshengii]MCF0041947.1 Txe/YoeB family addiction module toxin [Dyadobacter fanqingshengii]USJ36347.1 Txe/YoeB family addiction module toxin [Dyadobacter fanqingshengii]
MSYSIELTPKALEGIDKLKKSGNKPVLKKIRRLLEELTEHPYTGTGQPEQLKHNLAGFWSRRINQEHRIVYAVDEKKVTVTIISANGHYTSS